MRFEQIDAGGDRNFCYLIGDEQNRVCAVVDPGYDTAKLEARVRDLGFKVTHIFNTHTHRDHIAGNDVFRKGEVKLAAYKDAKVKPDIKLDHGDEIQVGNVRVRVMFTPGHYLERYLVEFNEVEFPGSSDFAAGYHLYGQEGRDPVPFISRELIDFLVRHKGFYLEVRNVCCWPSGRTVSWPMRKTSRF